MLNKYIQNRYEIDKRNNRKISKIDKSVCY